MAIPAFASLLFAIALTTLSAAAAVPDDVIHVDGGAKPVSVRAKQLRIADERTGALTFEQARSDADRFVTPRSSASPGGAASYWLRCALESDAENTERFAIFAGNWQHADYIIVYPDGHITEMRRGILDPIGSTDSPYATFLLRPHERARSSHMYRRWERWEPRWTIA